MPVSIPQINVASGGDTFEVFFERFNAVANAMTNVVLTTSASNTGATTVGNAYVDGIFGGAVLVTPTLRGGIVNAAATLNVASNVVVQGEHLTVGNSTVGTFINSTTAQINNASIANLSVTSLQLVSGLVISDLDLGYVQFTTTGTTEQVIDTLDLDTYRSAEYQFTIKDNTANAFQVSKLLVMHDGGLGYITEYGIVSSNGSLGAFAVSTNATSLILSMTPTTSNTTIKGSRITIGV